MAKKPNKGGRPPKITAQVEAEILAVLTVGGSLNDAADYVEIDRATLNRKLASDKGFAKRVNRAVSDGKLKLVKRVGSAEPWQAAAWMLERKWGSEFGKREQVDVTSDGKPVTFTLNIGERTIDDESS